MAMETRIMTRAYVLSTVVSIALALAGPAWAQRQDGPAAPAGAPSTGAIKGDADKGKTLFRSYGCDTCHGGEGQGSFAGVRLAPNPLPYQPFVRYVRAPRGVMPPYTETLLKSEQDLADIHEYLSTRPKPAPVSAMEQLGR